MIKVNLTPYEELDNPQWWVPDVVVGVLIILLTCAGTYFYIDSVEQEIAAKEAEKQNMITETAALEGEVKQFNELNSKIATLEDRKNSLKRITESKLIRYLPVILMENIQNLKPDKVWLTKLEFVDKKKDEAAIAAARAAAEAAVAAAAAAAANPPADGAAPAVAEAPVTPPPSRDKDFPTTIEIAGSAVDNIAIAEFMVALKATQNQNFEKSDLRTQLFFNDVGIVFSEVATDAGETKNDKYVNFRLILNFKEKLNTVQEGKFSSFIDEFKRTGHARIN